MLMYSAGLGASAASITELQTALVGLAQASGRPAINPGPANGQLTDATMMALAAGLSAAAMKIPKSDVASAISIALTLGATTSYAKDAVDAAADQLVLVVRAATIAYATGLISAGLSPQEQAAAAAAAQAKAQEDAITAAAQAKAQADADAAAADAARPWYKTWWGVGGIAVAAVLYLTWKPTASSVPSSK